MRVDVIYTGAAFRPGDGSGIANRLAVLGSRIVAVGADCDGLSAARTVDLGGNWVVPGFHDAHNHMAWFGLALRDLDLGAPSIRSVDDVYAAVAAVAAERPPGSWIRGTGYDDNSLVGGHPQRAALDRVAGDHPVWLQHRSGHMAVVNSVVLNRIDLRTVPPGGDVVRDAEGRPTGLIREQAQLLLRPLMYPTPTADLVEAIDRASRALLAEGVTSVQEAGVGGGLLGRTPVEVGAYQSALASGALGVRATLMVVLEELHDIVGAVGAEAFGLDLGLRSGFGDDRLRIGPVKLWADGSLIGRTAALSEPYSDQNDGDRGYFQIEEHLLRESIIKVHEAGWQIAAHAIGDRAVGAVLDAYAEALRRFPRADHRHRIEHCGLITAPDVARLADLGVIPVPQARFLHEIGDGMLAALGEKRMDGCYRQQSFLDAGVVLPASSDRPVVKGAPLLGMADAVQRRTAKGVVLTPQERIQPADALRAYTWGSAYAAFREHELGLLRAGYLADFAVLSADPLVELARDEPAIDVVATAIDGVLVHDPHGLSAPADR
ncbi:amidohydrolase [Pseudonocardia sp. GCM10023141]|uniref:amidohydrolase n=1 Tax=Pseudonocardia sp. GCM10023141 TaxID=3252653 RepID=UPI003608DE50